MAGSRVVAPSAGEITFLEAIRQAMFEEMERDPTVLLLGEDVGVYGGAFKTSAGLRERFGWERVIDTPICESAISGAACGMSYLGLRPWWYVVLLVAACTADRFIPRIRRCILCIRRDSRSSIRRRLTTPRDC